MLNPLEYPSYVSAFSYQNLLSIKYLFNVLQGGLEYDDFDAFPLYDSRITFEIPPLERSPSKIERRVELALTQHIIIKMELFKRVGR
jgi:hypothetical protein